MASTKLVDKIRESRQLTVYGYIRELEKSLSMSIPKEVILIFIIFYGNCRQWDPEWISPRQKLDQQSQIVTHVTNSCVASSFCEPIIEAKPIRHSWKFQIISVKGGGLMVIGIWKLKEGIEPPTNSYFAKGKRRGYAFDVRGPRLSDSRDGAVTHTLPYGVRCDTNDIIEMIVDLENKELSFLINGKAYGKAHDIELDRYRAAVWMFKAGDAVKLLE